MYKLIRNKKGQRIFVSLMVSVLVFILVIIMSPVLREETIRATNGSYSGNLSTDNTAISVPNRAALVVIDMMLFYFIAILIGASVSYVSGRKTFVQIATAIMVFVIISILITPLKTLIVLARDSSHLNCASITTTGQSLACIFVGLWLFYFVAVCIFTAVSYIFIKTTKAT